MSKKEQEKSNEEEGFKARIERTTGIKGFVNALERIEPADLQSILLKVYKNVANNRGSRLLSDDKSNRFVRPSETDPVALNEWDRIAFSHLPADFRALELSPICPIGSVSSVAPISQDWIMSTLRNSEVVSDSTNVLALESAIERSRLTGINPKDSSSVRLSCSHRVLRAQTYDDPEARSHFRLFSLCSAGRDEGNYRFEQKETRNHVRFYIASIRDYLGPSIPLHVSITTLTDQEKISEILENDFTKLKQDFAAIETELHRGKDANPYYRTFRFHIDAITEKGEIFELVDGGDTNWTQKLLNNSKERLLISAIGSERVCTLKKEKESK